MVYPISSHHFGQSRAGSFTSERNGCGGATDA